MTLNTSDISLGFNQLLDTVKVLRGDRGCPWDRKQTTLSLRTYLVEEFDEILSALDNEDSDNLCEELGDFLYLILMIAEINREQGNFDINRIIGSINEKLIRRHPHVFDSKEQLSEGELRKQWARIKEAEKRERKNS